MVEREPSLRQRLRAARRAVPDHEQAAAAEAIAATLAPLIEAAPETVAAFLATDGEPSPHLVVDGLRAQGSAIAYPRIEGDAMTFHLVADDADLVPGDWDLLEPAPGAPEVAPADLDVVLTPLVGFNAECHRVGRGKGYYDRTFAFLAGTDRPATPRLIGIAHDVQRSDDLPVFPHDIPLDAVVTPTTVYGTLAF